MNREVLPRQLQRAVELKQLRRERERERERERCGMDGR